ncbi:MAG: DUF4912 domain-containing protein [Treponema sp.]|jgi:hypothetical protein|nr:DUF4912 domain-containing protein [Treponema sp.]
MDDPCLEKAYLESLTTHELIKLADRFGIDIPPGLERIFIIEELVDLAAGDEPNSENPREPLREAGFLESVPLPKQYNITFIEVLPRDPLWVFTFWEVKGHDKELYERASNFMGYHLRVCPQDVLDAAGSDSSFIVPVEPSDTAWYLGFPPSGGRYRVELCVVRGDEAITLAVSHPFKMPKLLNPPKTVETGGAVEEQGVYKNPLSCLSGIKDLPVLRNGDRLSRMMRLCGSGTAGSGTAGS